MKLSDIATVLTIIVAIIAVSTFLAGLWGPSDQESTQTPMPTPTPTPTPVPPPPVTIEITNPKEGVKVSSSLTVKGTFDGELPKDWHLWMFAYNYEEWYPINRIVPFEGEWHSKVWLGPVTAGERDVVVVLGNEDADSEFQRYSEEDEFLRILPQGAQVCDRITVEVIKPWK